MHVHLPRNTEIKNVLRKRTSIHNFLPVFFVPFRVLRVFVMRI